MAGGNSVSNSISGPGLPGPRRPAGVGSGGRPPPPLFLSSILGQVGSWVDVRYLDLVFGRSSAFLRGSRSQSAKRLGDRQIERAVAADMASWTGPEASAGLGVVLRFALRSAGAI